MNVQRHSKNLLFYYHLNMCKFKLIKLALLLISITYSVNMFGANYVYNVQGAIVDNFTNKYLDSVSVTLMTNGRR